MPKNRRMRYMEESNRASGEVPEYGAIFMSSSSTRKECLRRELFGLPGCLSNFVKQVKAGMILFLFEFESRELHGVFQASTDGAVNIEPYAFRSSGKQFPAQVKITQKWRCRPLRESEFRLAICENYFTAKKFNFGLSRAQVQSLLKLFRLKKEERSRLIKSADAKHTRTSESNLGNTAGDGDFGNRCAGETDGDFDCEFPVGVTSAGDLLGSRLIENYGSGDKSDIGVEYDSTKGNEYSRNRSGVFGRLVDTRKHKSKDLVGYDLSMNNCIETDALAYYHHDRRVPKKSRHTASGWLENEYHEKDGIVQASNHKEHLIVKADPVVHAQSSEETPYGTSTECYDPCDPMILRDAVANNSRHELGAPAAPSVDPMGSTSYTANSNYVLRENSLPSGTVQPFPDEYNDSIMDKTTSPDSDYYIPMPTEHFKHKISTGMIGVGSESESGNGHLHHSQFPGLVTSEDATKNMMNFDMLSYSKSCIFPSFSNPSSSSRFLSPKEGFNNEITTYQPQEEFGSHFPFSKDKVVQDSRIYPSFTYPSTSTDVGDTYHESITHNEVQAYQQHEESGSDPFDSNNKVIQMKDRVGSAEHERKRTRKSVFSRLALPSKEQDANSSDTEPVDEVQKFLNECHEHWMEQERPNVSNHLDFGKQKREKIHAVEVLNNDFMPLCSDTTLNDVFDCEEGMENSAEKLPFIDFKRRSKALKGHGDPSQGCIDASEHSAPQNKIRKILRPRLIEDNSEKNRGNHYDPVRNVLASQTATEVPVPELLCRDDQ